jgi:hypothetical protein
VNPLFSCSTKVWVSLRLRGCQLSRFCGCISRLACESLALSDSALLHRNFGALFTNIEPNLPEETHVDVGHPHQGEACDQIAAPVRIQKFVARDDEESCRDVVAEAVLAGEEIEELAFVDAAAGLALGETDVTKLAYHFFMRNGPRNGCHG